MLFRIVKFLDDHLVHRWPFENTKPAKLICDYYDKMVIGNE